MKFVKFSYMLFLIAGLYTTAIFANIKPNQGSAINSSKLEKFLESAEVVLVEDTKMGITKPKRITLQNDDKQLRAVFKYFSSKINVKGRSKKKQLNKSDRYQYGVAAYQLDQLLELNMVPVTVMRKVNNQKGSVQAWVENSVVKVNLIDNKYKDLEVCDFQKQNKIMKVFDMLIYNDDRNLGNILYTLDDCRLWMIDHSRSFRVIDDIPDKLARVKIRLSEEFAEKLANLNYNQLQEHLGEFIKNSQIKSILKRRDLILELWRKNGKQDFLTS